ncbi:MAG: Mth938-like domain-containing protein [Burkholderiales bacterium]
MKLHLAQSGDINLITGYGEGFIEVNRQRYERPLVVLRDRVWTEWSATSFEALTADDLDALAKLNQEVILLGTGKKLRFPRAELMRPLIAARVGLEVMDSAAACRTYNILVAEERKVAAALLFT